MSTTVKPLVESDIAVGAMVYSRRIGDTQAISEGKKLCDLLETAKYGIVIDCKAVEMGTSEVVNMLLRVSKRAKKHGKHMALYNVPATLAKTFKIASLNSVFAVHDDGIMAKRKIYELSGVPDPEAPGFRLQFKLTHAALLAAFSVSVLIAVIIWLRNS